MEENTEAEEGEAPYIKEDDVDNNHDDMDIDHLSHLVRAYLKILKLHWILKMLLIKWVIPILPFNKALHNF